MTSLSNHTSSGHVRTRVYKALDLGRLDADHFARADNGKSLCFRQLPTATIDIDAQNIEDIAVLSWRWDVDRHTNSSRNAYIACQEATRQGVRYLLLDKVTVNQDQADEDMLIERLAFSQLYREIPVIAAYDDPNPRFTELTAEVHGTRVTLGSPFSRTMRRPWIFHEVDLYRANPTKVTYVGYIPGLGCDEELGFLHMAPRMWGSTLSQTILYTLAGIVSMHHVEDFRFIMPRYFDLLSAAHSKMSSNDYLLTAALLAGHTGHTDGRVNTDLSIDQIPFDQYRVGPGYTPDDLPKTQDYYTRYDICLGDRKVAEWQTRHKFYPFEELRVWFRIAGSAEHSICELLGVEKSPIDEPSVRTPSDAPGQPGPQLLIAFHEEDLLG
ncbi:hypothetical protein ACFL09_01845 [Planctomycetota bacterium]